MLSTQHLEAEVHVNYNRGETRTFVWRREHGQITHRTCHKGKRQSYQWGKVLLNRKERRQAAARLARGVEKVTRCVRHGELLWMMI